MQFVFIILVLLLDNIYAGPKLVTSTQMLDFGANSKFQYLSIANNGDEKAYVKFTAKKIRKNHAGKHIILDAKKSEIIITPKKLILKPGQSRKVKVIKRLKGNTADHFFRVYSSTVPMPNSNPEALSKDSVGLKVHVAIGTNTLVIFRPNKLKPKINTEKKNEKIIIENSGNTTIKLHQIKQCDSNNCISYRNKIIYPKSKKVIKLKKPNLPLMLTQNINGEDKALSIS